VTISLKKILGREKEHCTTFIGAHFICLCGVLRVYGYGCG